MGAEGLDGRFCFERPCVAGGTETMLLDVNLSPESPAGASLHVRLLPADQINQPLPASARPRWLMVADVRMRLTNQSGCPGEHGDLLQAPAGGCPDQAEIGLSVDVEQGPQGAMKACTLTIKPPSTHPMLLDIFNPEPPKQCVIQ